MAKEPLSLGFADKAFINAAIANAGNVSRGIDLSKQSVNDLRALAHKAVDTAVFREQSVLGAPKDGILNAYVDDLVNRSLKMDRETGAAEGTHLRQFFSDTRDATKNIDFDAAKKDPIAYFQANQAEVKKVQAAIHKSASENVDARLKNGGLTIEQDVVNTYNGQADDTQSGPDYSKTSRQAGKPIGGDLMTIILAFLGMLLGIDLGAMFGGQQDQRNPSYEEAAANNAPATPDQQKTIEDLQNRITKMEKEKAFSRILSDKGVNKSEFSGLLALTPESQRDATLVALGNAPDNFIVLTPNAQGADAGNVAIYAKQGADGKLTDIQVATTDANGVIITKAVDGNFSLTAGSEQAVATAIQQEAAKSGRVVDNSAANVVADNLAVNLRVVSQQVTQERGRP